MCAMPLRPSADEAIAAYRAAVVANRAQVERLRDLVPPAGGDFWVDRAARFRPGALDAEEMPALEAIALPDDVWMDIGAGGGRFALPVARLVAQVIAVEPSAAMRAVLAEAFASEARTNYEVLDLRWPPSPSEASQVPVVDVSLIANVLYDAADVDAFLAAAEAHTRRRCVVITSDRAPSTPDADIWQALYGEALCPLPALTDFVAVLGALGRRYDITTFPVRGPEPVTLDRALDEMRWRYWVAPGSDAEARLGELFHQHFGQPSGLIQLPPRRNYSAVVSWDPAPR